MTSRKKIMIIAAVTLLIIVGAISLIITLTKTPETATPPVAVQPTDETPQNSDPHTDAEGEPFAQADQNVMIESAAQAARAYVMQPEKETAKQREARLDLFFAPGSPVIAAAAPVPSTRYSTLQVNNVESTWYKIDKENAVGVLVYLDVIGRGLDTEERYQGWVVELRKYNNEWLPYDITRSDLRYISGDDL